ncbi:hypothetical protein CR513_03841, partial [Mucuna pruriens]
MCHLSTPSDQRYFYEGLSMMDKSMIDGASGEALMDKTPATTRHLISNMTSNARQFGIRGPSQSQMVNEIGATSNQRLENQLTELTSLVRQLVVGQHQLAMAAKVCGICTSVEHPTNMCPTLQETESDQPENVGAIGGFQYGKQSTESRALYNSTIQIHTECIPETSRLSIADSAISSTTFPTTAATENAASRQFPISRGSNKAASYQQSRVRVICELQQHTIPAEYDCHHPRPQDTDKTISKNCEPIIVGRIKQPSLSNHSKSERKCRCNHCKKWKRTASTCTIAVAEISRGRLAVPARQNCPSVVPNSDHLNKEAKVR